MANGGKVPTKIFLRLTLFISTSFLISCMDQHTKNAVRGTFELGERSIVIPKFFDVTFSFNRGVAFGMLSDLVGANTLLIFLTSLIALVVFYIGIFKTETKSEYVCYSFIFGGALGNIVDRLLHGAVVDWLSFHVSYKYYYPTFNLADSFIVVGILLLMFNLLLKKRMPSSVS